MHLNVYIYSASLQCSNLNCFTYQIRRWLIYLTNGSDTGSALVFIFLSSNIYSLKYHVNKSTQKKMFHQCTLINTNIHAGFFEHNEAREHATISTPVYVRNVLHISLCIDETNLTNSRNHVYLHALWYLMEQCLC